MNLLKLALHLFNIFKGTNMTGKQLKYFVHDQGWTSREASSFFKIAMTTLFEQYRRKKVTGPIARISEIYLMLPKTRRAKINF
jgi:hypothetical protein